MAMDGGLARWALGLLPCGVPKDGLGLLTYSFRRLDLANKGFVSGLRLGV